ncbi:MAG: glycosyltransferase family 2 protein, partial [Betaproteobacteria bacterium]
MLSRICEPTFDRDLLRMIDRSACPPVLIVGFNRPHTTTRVLESLRAAKPARVFFAVDGPRPDAVEDASRVDKVQSLVSLIDWDCEVQTLFRSNNLGCKLGVSSAISWFFQQVDAGIILEDDCIAHPSFFPYVRELLGRYAVDERLLMISGNNFQADRRKPADSYYFSRYAHIWGWATWRRAWQHYDHE